MKKILWQFEDIIEATSGRGLAQPSTPVTSVSIDTRTLEPGALFIPIRGDVHDGHKFIPQAFAKGAACALVAEDFENETTLNAPLIYVSDTLKAMQDLGKESRARCGGKMIAVTGSVGKTGTKEALKRALSPQGKTHASAKSYNNHWGVPLSLARMPHDTQYGIFEIGMNHPGEITPLTRFVRPHIAIVTTVAPVHLGFFNSVVEIAEAKAEIFLGLEPNGYAVLNKDNAYFELLKTRAESVGAEIISFGETPDAQSRLLNMTLQPENTGIEAQILDQTVKFSLGAPGQHLAMNALAVLTAVKLAGGDVLQAADTFAQIRAQKGRGERHVYKIAGVPSVIVDESYNANPASMQAALQAFSQLPGSEYKRRIIVLGDMLELGEHSERLHRELKQPILAASTDLVFACGPYMAALYACLPEGIKGGYAESSDKLKEVVLNSVALGDAIMIKGSLGSAMEPIVTALQDHFEGLKK